MFGLKKEGTFYSAKQMGEMIGLSAKEVNVLLKKKGFLEGEPGNYSVTAKGQKYSEVRDKDNGYGGYAERNWAFVMWDVCVLKAISNLKYPDIDWSCDGCGAFLNRQKGFTDKKGKWKCKECGYINDVTANNIIK